MLDEGFLRIKKQYIKTFKEKTDELEAAFEEKNSDAMLRFLHKLAGSSGGYGYNKVSQLCVELRDLIESNFNKNIALISEKVETINSILMNEFNNLKESA